MKNIASINNFIPQNNGCGYLSIFLSQFIFVSNIIRFGGKGRGLRGGGGGCGGLVLDAGIRVGKGRGLRS